MKKKCHILKRATSIVNASIKSTTNMKATSTLIASLHFFILFFSLLLLPCNSYTSSTASSSILIKQLSIIKSSAHCYYSHNPDYCELPQGFEHPSPIGYVPPPKVVKPIPVYDLNELKHLIKLGYRVPDLDVRGNANLYLNSTTIHPVVKALYLRAKQKSIPGQRTDGRKIAIAIEGGGMRGCVAAGMITAIAHLGLEDTVDIVYGSSAGSLVGAYFIARQLPYTGPEVYYDILTTAGKEFIDAMSILRSCGLGILDFRLKSIIELFTDRIGKPVLNLDYLLGKIVKEIKPLDWDAFWKKQVNKEQVLKVIASGLLSEKAVIMSSEANNFSSLNELTECMKASMLLPGVTGDLVRLKGAQADAENIQRTWWREYASWKDSKLVRGSEPMSDAQMFEPIPYRSALRENCTHILVLRTRPDDVTVTNKMGLIEKMIMARFFGRKQGLPKLVTWMNKQYHKLVYAEDMLVLNKANMQLDESDDNIPQKMLSIAIPPGYPEVKRLETSRTVIFSNVRQGFAVAFDSLVADPALRGQGLEIAMQIWPDSILDSIPSHLSNTTDSATLPVAADSLLDVPHISHSKRAKLLSGLQRLKHSILGVKVGSANAPVTSSSTDE